MSRVTQTKTGKRKTLMLTYEMAMTQQLAESRVKTSQQ